FIPMPHQPSPISPISLQLIPLCPHSLPVPPSVSISLWPSSSQPGPGCLLCSVMDFYPAEMQLSWFQGQQELSGHVVATDLVPVGTGFLPAPGVAGTPPVEPVLWGPVSCGPPEMLPENAGSKVLMEIGGFVLGFGILVLGLGFYLCKKVRGDLGPCAPLGPPARCDPVSSANRAPEPAAAAAPP
ncbi:hypothetical protein Nmel_015245, partial [Mimus melanotis]